MPMFGHMQATYGQIGELPYPLMKKQQSKRRNFVSQEIRVILGSNVDRLMKQQFPGMKNQAELLGNRIGTSRSTVERIIRAEVGCTLDRVAQLAMGLRCEAYELLIPPGRETETAT